jgi:hypothetical protein
VLTRYLAILLAIGPSLSAQNDAHKQGDINLSSTCFDSLPYNVAHPCNAFTAWKSKATLGTLYTRVNSITATDSLSAAAHDSSDTGVAVVAPPQAPHGKCAKPTNGPDWISPSIAIHFDATRLSKKESRYVILVQGSATAVEGNTDGSMVLALCYLARYRIAIQELDSLPSGH